MYVFFFYIYIYLFSRGQKQNEKKTLANRHGAHAVPSALAPSLYMYPTYNVRITHRAQHANRLQLLYYYYYFTRSPPPPLPNPSLSVSRFFFFLLNFCFFLFRTATLGRHTTTAIARTRYFRFNNIARSCPVYIHTSSTRIRYYVVAPPASTPFTIIITV